MPSGTFERFAKIPTYAGADWTEVIPGVVAALGSGENGTTQALLDSDTDVIYLDGDYNNPIGINDLPPGFTILTANLNAALNFSINSGGNNNDLTALGLVSPYDFSTDFSEIIVPISPLPTNSGLFGTYTIETTNVLAAFPAGGSLILNLLEHNDLPGMSIACRIYGTYETQSFSYQLAVPTEPVEPSDSITVTSDEPDPLDFTQITGLIMVYPDGTEVPIDPSNWTTVEEFLFVFVIPSFGADEPTVLTFVVTSTQFSGTVTLGRLITIYFTSATGIYQLDWAKYEDTLYIEDDPGETVDVKIPNPFIKTGFVGG